MTVIGVSQILSEKFNLDARPGQKVVCPFCDHKTFFVKRDDSIGKCFHPDCGRFITPSQFDKHYKNSLHSVLEAIFYDFHQALMDLRDVNHYPNTLTYLIDKRGFHPKVIQDAMIGCVPSGGYDLEAKFRPLIEELEAAAAADGGNEKKGKGKKPTFTADERLKFVQKAKRKLAECLERRAGWICFFYTDAAKRITSIKFRQPYSKIFVSFKPFKHAGVFGAMFRPGEQQKQLNHCLFVEGEGNLLALQSLALRYAEFLKIETDYVPCFAVGGAQSADFETVKKLSKHPVLIIDNDEAGFGMLDQARQVMTVEALTTPKADSDLDSYIAEFGQDYQGAYTSIQKLVAERQLYPRYYESVAMAVKLTRNSDAKTHIINDMVAAIIREDLKDRGKFFNDGQKAYFFFANEKKLISVDQDDTEFILLLNRYSINRADHIFKYILESLWFESFENGTRTTIYKLSYFDSKSYTLYIFNHENRIYKITPNKIEIVDNGSDGILFLINKYYKPFQLVDIDKSFSYLEKYLIQKINFKENQPTSDNNKDYSLTPDERKMLFRLWFKAIFFASIMPTKPLMGFIGPKGSGKTIVIRKVGILLFGPNFNVTTISKDEKDFDAAISNGSYVAVDNVDTRIKWLNDRLAAVATGQNLTKRELYTTNRLVEFPVSCFLALSSRSPNFRRDDVADRLLIMYVVRFKKFTSEKTLINEMLANRDAIMTELLRELQDAVRALKAGAGKDDSNTFRMADFADFAMKVARHEGREVALQEIFKKMSREQSEFTLEDDPIFDLLLHWVSVDGNSGRFITNKELCEELTKLADELKINFPYRGEARSFTNRMTNIRSNLEEFFVINHKPGPQRSNFYSYELKVN